MGFNRQKLEDQREPQREGSGEPSLLLASRRMAPQ
jgi:hypothetical protein